MTAYDHKPFSNSLKTPLSASGVRVAFLELLRYAVRGGMEEKEEAYVEDIALLFDQLIDLVAAAEALRQEGGAVSGSGSESETGSISSSLTGREGGAHE